MEDSKVRGIHFEILDQISKKSGLTLNYKFYPHLRLTNSIEATNADLAIFFSASCLKYPQTYEIQTKLYTSKPTLFLKESVTLKKENLRIGLIRGTRQSDTRSRYLPQKKPLSKYQKEARRCYEDC